MGDTLIRASLQIYPQKQVKHITEMGNTKNEFYSHIIFKYCDFNSTVGPTYEIQIVENEPPLGHKAKHIWYPQSSPHI